MLAPVSLFALFNFASYDILFMGIHTMLINFYAAYYVMDPAANENYSWLRADRSDMNTYFGSDGIATQIM